MLNLVAIPEDRFPREGTRMVLHTGARYGNPKDRTGDLVT